MLGIISRFQNKLKMENQYVHLATFDFFTSVKGRTRIKFTVTMLQKNVNDKTSLRNFAVKILISKMLLIQDGYTEIFADLTSSLRS